MANVCDIHLIIKCNLSSEKHHIEALAQLARMQHLDIHFTDIRPGFVATDLLKSGDVYKRQDYEMLLRVPGIGVKSARLIVASRRFSKIGFYQLKKIGVKAPSAAACPGQESSL